MAKTYYLGRNEGRHPDHDRAASKYPARRLLTATAATYKYWYQGTKLDQEATGTCVAHALGHRRANSPVIIDGITHQWAIDLYVEATGDNSLQEGTWAQVVARRMLERSEISGFYWVNTPEELRQAVLTIGPVAVGTYWYNSMFDPISKYSNKYLVVDPTSGIAGGHEYLVNGINLFPTSGKPFYRILNSWGDQWGKGGTARIECEKLEDLIFNNDGDAVVLDEVKAA